MDKSEAIKILTRYKAFVCMDCIHPSEVGWCENYCKLPQAIDTAIEALSEEKNEVKEVYYV